MVVSSNGINVRLIHSRPIPNTVAKLPEAYVRIGREIFSATREGEFLLNMTVLVSNYFLTLMMIFFLVFGFPNHENMLSYKKKKKNMLSYALLLLIS